jgi:hypothetical protein
LVDIVSRYGSAEVRKQTPDPVASWGSVLPAVLKIR